MKTKRSFEIIYEDRDVILVYKPSGLLTIATDKDDRHNLYHYVREYLNRKRQRVFVVHRLDRDTSGLVLFAKSFEKKQELQGYFERGEVKRKYEAVVEERLNVGTKYHVEQYLFRDDRSGLIFPTKDKAKGKKAVTDFKVTNEIKAGSVLDIDIHTGRQNQIRIALHTLGFTLIGDKKYANSHYARMLLNAYELDFPKNARLKQTQFHVEPLWLK